MCKGRGPGLALGIELAESGVCPGSWGLERVLRPPLHALTQQEHRPGAPRLACHGLPTWPRPSQASVPCQASAEHLHRVPQASPHWPWPCRLSGQQATGTSVPFLEPRAEPSLGLPSSLHLWNHLPLRRTFPRLAG